MENIKWLRLSGLGCFLLIFGSSFGTFIFTITWVPRIQDLTLRIMNSFILIFQVTSYFIIAGSIIIVIGLIFFILKRYIIAGRVMLIGLVIALLALLLYFFGAIEATLAYTIRNERLIVLLPLLTINFTFELIGVSLNFLSKNHLTERRIYQKE